MKKILISCMALMLCFSACKRNESTSSPAPTDDLNTYLSTLKPVNAPTPLKDPLLVGDSIANWSASDGLYCKSAKYKLGPEYNEGFLLNPSTAVIFPGAILDGNSIYNGGYTLLSLPRTGGTITTDNKAVTKSSITIDETVYSKVQQAILDINQTMVSTSSAGANLQFKIEDIYSAQQLDMGLKFSVKDAAGVNSIKGGFKFNSNVKKSRILVKFQQIYYSMVYDAKQKPADYFQPGVTPKQVSTTINGQSIAPLYVSTVKYGRTAYCSFESDLSQKDLKATLEGRFKGGVASGSVDADFKAVLTKNNTTSQGVIIGGSGKDAVASISGIDGVINFIKNGGEYSASSPGLPVAYTLNRISDNQTFSVVDISEYTVNQCYSTTGAIKLNAARHVTGGQDDNIWGTVSANLGYDSQNSFANAATNLWTQSSAINLPSGGTSVPLASNNYNLIYDPAKFNEAYLVIAFNVNNRYHWENVGLDNHSGDTDDNLTKTYKVYLKDIIDNKLGSDWSINNTQSSVSFDLNVNMDGTNAVDWACVKKNIAGGCSSRSNIDVSKAASIMYFNFSININKQ